MPLRLLAKVAIKSRLDCDQGVYPGQDLSSHQEARGKNDGIQYVGPLV
jgi:hypothetical protein